jgi:drug/metabolite transporter (DMT)-like permease
VLGIMFQLIGFTLAFFARRELPLFLVQASVAAGLGVMALLGVLFMRWRLARTEIGLLALLGGGIGALVFAAKPGVAHHLHAAGFTILVAALVVIGVLGFFAARLHGTVGSLTLGSLAGLAFGAAAVDSRALAGARHLSFVVTHPLLYLLFAHALLGQMLLGMAMQRGPTTVAVAAMDAASTAPAAIIGLALLGDQIEPGRQWIAALGFVVTLGAVLGLARYAQPQHVTRAAVASRSWPANATYPLPARTSGHLSPRMVAPPVDTAA